MHSFLAIKPTVLSIGQDLIKQHFFGKTGKINAQFLRSIEVQESVLWKWVKDETHLSINISDAGRIHLIIAGNPKCPICSVLPRAYFNGVLKTCGSDDCVRNSKIASIKSVKRERSPKQKQFIQDNLKNFLSKSRETILTRYGVSNPYSIPAVKRKAIAGKKASLEETKKDRLQKRLLSLSDRLGVAVHTIEQLESEWISYKCQCGFLEEKTLYTLINRKEKTSIACKKCSGLSSGSLEQKALFDFVSSNVYAEQNNRKVLSPYEVDIWIPSLNLGIEYNGIFWHSSPSVKSSDRHYHQKKALLAKERGINLIQVWSHWDKDKVRSILSHHLQLDTKIHARKTEFKQIDKKYATRLLKLWHLDGSVSAEHYFCLEKDNEPLMIASFGASRFSGETELLRCASKPGITVVGGLSKLLKNSIRELQIERLVSFARLEFSGTSYLEVGAKLISITEPAENWIHLKTGKIISRFGAQKHKLPLLLETFNANLSAHQNLENNGWRVFWYAGNQKFELTNSLQEPHAVPSVKQW